MKTVSVTVPEADYEVFRRAAQAQPVVDLPVLHGHRPIGELPTRADIHDEIFADETGKPQ